MPITEIDVNKVLADATNAISEILAKSEASLEKKEEEKKEPESKEKDKADDKAEAKDDAKSKESAVPAVAKDEGEEPAPEASGDDMAMAEDPDAGEDAPAEEGAPEEEAGLGAEEHPDKEQDLHEIYAVMSDDDLRAHYLAIKSVILSRCEGEVEPSDGEQEEPMDAGAEMPAQEEPEMETEEPEMAKSEVEEKVSALEAKLEEKLGKLEKLEKSMDSIASFLETAFVKPQRKAQVSTEDLVKSEAPAVKLDRKAVLAQLNVVADRRDLAKSDREAINDYVLNPTASLELVAHLLKK